MSGQSGSRLDQIVKGAAPLGTTVPSVASRSPSPAPSGDDSESRTSQGLTPAQASDPLALLPSSPPQIYLNLLILEASLRSQYLTLRARRRQNTFFILLLTFWNAFFFYALFLRPREDGSGVGGSVYWVIEMAEKVALMGGVVTGILIWGTGQWDRGVRWPRRFVGIANRGLRTMNAKIIVIKGPWWRELLGHMVFLFPYSSFFPSQGSSYHYLNVHTEKRAKHGKEEEAGVIREEDLSPGGDHIKLLLLPKPFSPDFRENWELYRTEYWERENERRAAVLRQLRQLERKRAKEEGGWLWWTGWRGWKRAKGSGGDVEKSHHGFPEKEIKHRITVKKSDHSRNSSRSSTPTLDVDEKSSVSRSRRGSSSGSQTESRRRVKGLSSLGPQQQSKLTPTGPHPNTPSSASLRSPLVRATSNVSGSSGNESDRSQEARDEVA
ncbi:MAG: hypothetical protein MMC33_001715 [Icmadophila ericetorum]|nr:hypothetical protein [Icmadophila ericetorum]